MAVRGRNLSVFVVSVRLRRIPQQLLVSRAVQRDADASARVDGVTHTRVSFMCLDSNA